MNKGELLQALSEETGVRKEDIKVLLEAFMKVIKKETSEGGSVGITNFGRFYVFESKEKRGVNPITGEPIIYGPRKTVKFKPGLEFRKMVADGPENKED